jgi:Family of unknown function (DUF6282)/TAT (twin-arginine translocation) pathway signal sequence
MNYPSRENKTERSIGVMKKSQEEEQEGFTRRDFLRVSAGTAGAVALGSLPALASAEKSGGPASDDVVNELLRGAIDTHIHGGPDVIQRKLSDIDIAREAKAAGMKAVITKCHVTSTTSRAILAQEAVGKGVLIFGGFALNKAEGGLNVDAVATEIKIGAREIWLPTFWSESHIKLDKKNPADAVKLTDDKGVFRPELFEIFDLIAKKDIILGTGHTTPDEMERFIPLAKQRGVKRILITHPEWLLPNMSIDVQKRLVRYGVFFERCAQSLYPAPNPWTIPPQAYVDQIKATGAEFSTLATDLGQVYNPTPVEGLRHFIKTLLAGGISPKDIEIMAKRNPAQILGV